MLCSVHHALLPETPGCTTHQQKGQPKVLANATTALSLSPQSDPTGTLSPSEHLMSCSMHSSDSESS